MTVRRGITPENGFVPDEQTAVKIAEAVLLPVFGEKIHGQLPFRARLADGQTWVVHGTLPQGMLGGTGHVEISKLDGRILFMTHGK